MQFLSYIITPQNWSILVKLIFHRCSLSIFFSICHKDSENVIKNSVSTWTSPQSWQIQNLLLHFQNLHDKWIKKMINDLWTINFMRINQFRWCDYFVDCPIFGNAITIFSMTLSLSSYFFHILLRIKKKYRSSSYDH